MVPKTLLAVPTRGIINAECSLTHHQLAADLDTELVYQYGGNSAASNRNMIVRRFLASDCEVLMMVDDDIGCPAEVATLPGKLEDWDVVSAACPMFVPERWPLPVYAAFVKGQPGKYALMDDRRKEGLTACDGVGSACIAIHRRVFDHIPEQPFQETIHDTYTESEDIAFCLHCNDAGLRIAIDFDVVCDHIRAFSLLAMMRGMQEVHRQLQTRYARPRLADQFGQLVPN